MVNFTTDDILLYINNELSPKQTISFENELVNNWSLQERYSVLFESTIAAKLPLLQPSERSVKVIRDYARKTVPEII
jgi:hypothetical protein